MSGKTNVWARRKARRALVQAVYQWQVSGNDISSVIDDFTEGDSLKKADSEFFNRSSAKPQAQWVSWMPFLVNF